MRGPFSDVTEPLREVYTSASVEAMWRKAAVEQLSSCSACNMKIASIALMIVRFLAISLSYPKHILRKL